MTSSVESLLDKHREVLDRAVAAIGSREYWSRYPESPSPRVYGEEAAAAGEAAYQAHLGKRYEALAGQPLFDGRDDAWTGSEVSPYGPRLGVTYPRYGEAQLDELGVGQVLDPNVRADAGGSQGFVCTGLAHAVDVSKRNFQPLFAGNVYASETSHRGSAP